MNILNPCGNCLYTFLKFLFFFSVDIIPGRYKLSDSMDAHNVNQCNWKLEAPINEAMTQDAVRY